MRRKIFINHFTLFLLMWIFCDFTNAQISSIGAVPKISQIQVIADGEVDQALVIQSLGFIEGEVYSVKRADEGMIRIAELGRFKSVEGQFDLANGRFLVKLKLVETLAGIDVIVSNPGQSETLESNVNEVVGVSVGDPIFVDLFDEIRSRIENRFFDRGYLSAKVALALEQKDKSSRRRLLVNLDLGPRTRVGKFLLRNFNSQDVRELFNFIKEQNELEQFVSSLKFKEALALSGKVLKNSIGSKAQDVTTDRELISDVPLDWIAITATLSKWASTARQDGYFDFSAKANVRDESLKDDKVEVEILLNRGTQYNVQLKNNVLFWERDLRSKVLDRTLRLGVPFNSVEAENILKRRYESLGFKDLKVETKISDDRTRRKIVFDLDEGAQYFVGNVRLEGLSEAESVDLLSVPKDWMKAIESPFHRTYYDESLLKSRLKDLLRMVRTRGFLQARILEFRSSPADKKNEINIEISVQLGPKYFVRNVSVLGNRILRDAELDQIVTFVPGKPVNPSLLLDISQELIKRHQDMGFPGVKVVDDEKKVFKIYPESNDVDIEINIDSGPQIILGNIYIQGLKQTKNEVVMRELAVSEVFSQKIWRLSDLSLAEQRLLGLGIFASTRFESSGGRILERPSGGAGVEKQERDLRIDISEKNAGAFEFGPGYRTDLGGVLFAEFNYRNLGGLNRAAVLRAQISRKIENYEDLEQKYSATFLEPYIYNDPTRVRFNISYSLDDQYVYNKSQKINGYLVSEFSLGIGADRELTDNLRLTHNIFTFSLPRIINPVLSDSTVSETKKYRIGTMGSTLTFDTRDNLFTPTRGLVSSLSFEYAAPWIASDNDAHFIVGRSALSSYIPLGSEGVVLASSLKYSRLKGLGSTTGIPENKRLNLGGLASIRSIDEGALLSNPGALVEQQSAEVKIEFRQPIFLDLGIAYFADAGKIWASKYLAGQAPSDTGLRMGIGAGLRYNFVVGPVSADLVFNPNPKDGLGSDTVKFLLSVGTF